MNTRQIPALENESDAGFMQLTIDTMNLLLPVDQVVSLESVLDIAQDSSVPGVFGYIKVAGSTWPVFNLDEDLQVVNTLNPARKICVCVGHGENGFGVVCDQIDTLLQHEFELVALPPCMKAGDTPVTALAIRDKHVMSVTDADAVQRLVSQLQQANPDEPES